MRYLILLIFLPPLLLGIAGVLFSLNKLEHMKQIRGSKPGATTETQVVFEKWEDKANGGYWISLTEKDIRVPGNHRLNLPRKVWDHYEIGDEIEIVYLPGDSNPYHRESIYADDGNFAFDRGLLVVEFGLIVVALFGAAGTFAILKFRRRKG